MFPVLPFKRSGRHSCPPEKVVVAPLEREAGFNALETVLRQTVDRVVQRTNGGVQVAFEEIADYLMKYKTDDLGERLHQTISNVLAPEIGKMEAGTSVSHDLVTGSMMALDQLFSLQLRRDPQLREVIHCVREIIHRSVYPNPPIVQNLPQVLLREYEINIADDFLRPFQPERTYFEATAELVTRLVSTNGTLAKTRECLDHHMKSTKWYLKTWRKLVLSKALVCWRLQAKCDKAVRLLKSEAVDREEKLQKCQQELTHIKAQLKTTQVDLGQQIELLRAELLLTQKAHDTAISIAETRKKEAADLRDQVQYMEMDQFADMRVQLNELEAQIFQWKEATTTVTVSAADNPFEQFNRNRLEFYMYNEPAVSMLFQWATDIVKFLPQGGFCKFADFTARNCGASYVLLMHCLSPGHVPHSAVDTSFGSGLKAQMEAVIYYASQLQIGKTPLNLQKLMHGNPGEHYSLLLSLYGRFCGIGASTPWLPPNEGDWKIWARRMDTFPAASFQAQETYQSTEEALFRISSTAANLDKWGLSAAKLQATISGHLLSASMKKGIVVSIQDKEQFCTLNSTQLSDIDDVTEESIGSIEREVLTQNCNEIRLIYLFYATGALKVDTDVSMSKMEFSELIQDTKLVQRGFLKASAVNSIYDKCTCTSLDASMYPKQYVESLVRLAAKCEFPSPSDEEDEDDAMDLATLHGKVKCLVENYILKYTNGAAIAEFKTKFHDTPVQDVMENFGSTVKKVFRHYAAEEPGDLHNEMNEKEFQRFCSEAKIADEVCTYIQLQQLFAKIPDTSIEVRKLYESEAGGKSKGLKLNEFKQLISAIALLKMPSPFVALHTKVGRFIEGYLVPMPLQRK